MNSTQNKKEIAKDHMKNNNSLKVIIIPKLINQVTSRWTKKNMANKPMSLQILIINIFQKQSPISQTMKFIVIKSISHILNLRVSNRIVSPSTQLAINLPKKTQMITLYRVSRKRKNQPWISRKRRNQSWVSRKKNNSQQSTKSMKNQLVASLKSQSFRILV